MIGDRVKELRKLLGMSQKELAEKLGLKSQTTIAAIESNKNNPSNELLSNMSDLFKVSTDFLLEKVELDGGYLRLLLSVKLKEKMKKEGLTESELSKKLNVSVQDLIIIKNAQLDMNVLNSYRTVAEYVELPLMDLYSLMTYASTTLKLNYPEDIREDVSFLAESPSVVTYGFINIPILGVVRAGLPILATENIEGHIPLPTSMISSNKEYFALKVTGDSMNLEFKEGDILVAEKTNIAENGEIGVILVNGYEATVKKVVHNKNMITLIPMSTNPIHTPTMYDIEKDDVKIVGKIKHAIKSY